MPATVAGPAGPAPCLPFTRSTSSRSACATIPPEPGRSPGRLARSDKISASSSFEMLGIARLRPVGHSGVVLRHDRHRRTGERHAARRRFVEHHPQRIQVGAVVKPPATRLLRAHVMRRAPDDTGLVSLIRECDHREPEVRELGHVARSQQHVGRLDVAMDHPLVVGVIESFGHECQDVQPLGKTEMTPPFGIARAVHLFHHQKIRRSAWPKS